MSDQKFRVEVAADKAITDIKKLTDEFNKLDKAGGGVDKSTKKMSKGFGTLQKSITGVIAGGALLGFMSKVLSATKQQERALALLDSQLKNTKNSVGFTTAELAAYASELQNVSIYGDETIMEAQAALLSFKNVQGEVFTDATRLALDLSTVMGMDLAGSIRAMGKALNDPILGLTALSRGGTTFSESQSEVIKKLAKTGQVAKAQRLILQELEAQYGGASAAAVDTFGGSLDKLGNAFADLFEAKGGLEDGKRSIQELTDLLQDPKTVEGMNNIVSGVVQLTTVLAKAAIKISEFVVWISEGGKALGLFLYEINKIPTPLEKAEAAAEQFGLQVEFLEKQIKKAKDLGQPYAHFETALKRIQEQARLANNDVGYLNEIEGQLKTTTEELGEEVKKTTKAVIDFGNNVALTKDQLAALKEAEKEQIAYLKQMASLMDNIFPEDAAFVKHNEQLALIKRGMADGTIEWEKGSEAIKRLVEDFSLMNEVTAENEDAISSNIQSFGELRKTQVEGFKVMTLATADWGQRFADTLLDGEANMGNFVKSALDQMARMTLASAMNPIFSAFGMFIDGAIGGLSANFAGNGMTSQGGFGGLGIGNPGSYGGTYASVLHGGGVVSESSVSRAVPSELFQNAPRYHNGFLASGEKPAILKDDESVLTPGQMKQVSSSSTVFSPTYNIDARGAAPGVDEKVRSVAKEEAENALAGFKREISRGGSAAKIVGRRR